jgi:hypothetical protein
MPDGLPPANGIESNVKLRVKTPQGSQPGLATNLSTLLCMTNPLLENLSMARREIGDHNLAAENRTTAIICQIGHDLPNDHLERPGEPRRPWSAVMPLEVIEKQA